VKRILDIAASALLLFLLAPVLAVCSLVIVLESPGPVFYRARRVGVGGAPLYVLKFRKMRDDIPGGPLTMSEDRRFTRVGWVLTKTKLDELPQLWNVLRGEMSLVGPRPEDPQFVDLHARAYSEINSVRPGITGLSQLAFAAEAEILERGDPMSYYIERILPQKARMDRLYVRRRTVWLDFKILVWTFLPVLLRRDVAVNRHTAALSIRRRPEEVQQPQPAPAVESIALAPETGA
jgi:lipopolysaccharide/colanic/teichoic acid biosynthesis glycosyltransferase